MKEVKGVGLRILQIEPMEAEPRRRPRFHGPLVLMSPALARLDSGETWGNRHSPRHEELAVQRRRQSHIRLLRAL